MSSLQKQRIGIHGVPRSGTSWLGEIINSSPQVIYKYQPLFSYELKNFLDLNSDKKRIDEFFLKLENTKSDFLDQVENKSQGIKPAFRKSEATHIVYKEVRYHHLINHLLQTDKTLKIIAIIRSPMAVINSWLNSPREFRKDLGWNEMEEWENAQSKNCGREEEFFGYRKWKEAAEIFIKLSEEYSDRFLLISYSGLIKDTEILTREIFSFSELEITSQTLDFIKDSRTLNKPDTYSVYKSRDTDEDWKKSLNKEIIDKITRDLSGTGLQKYL